MTKCRICNRRLTAPLSVSRGIGPICWFKLTQANQTGLHGVEAGDTYLYSQGGHRQERHADGEKIGRRVTALVTN